MRLGAAFVLALLLPASAAAQAPTVRPGDEVNRSCTLGWLFDGSDGGAYFATAGHCFEAGTKVTTGGEPLGIVALRGADTTEPGEDVELIRVDESMEPRVTGAMRGHPDIPSGIASPVDAMPGDLLRISGWGIGFDGNATTREQRAGEFVSGDAWTWAGVSPIINGDSGGPVAHLASGTAFGLNKGHGCKITVGVAAPMCGTVGPSVAAIQRLGEGAGLTLTLRLANQPAPPKPAASQPPAQQAPAPAPSPAKPAPAKKRSAKAACRKKARKITNKRKRKAALKRCAKKRS